MTKSWNWPRFSAVDHNLSNQEVIILSYRSVFCFSTCSFMHVTYYVTCKLLCLTGRLQQGYLTLSLHRCVSSEIKFVVHNAFAIISCTPRATLVCYSQHVRRYARMQHINKTTWQSFFKVWGFNHPLSNPNLKAVIHAGHFLPNKAVMPERERKKNPHKHDNIFMKPTASTHSSSVSEVFLEGIDAKRVGMKLLPWKIMGLGWGDFRLVN